jgi:hypothetical protein
MPLAARFGDFAQVVGYDLAPAALKPGEPLKLRLYFRALASAPENYVLFAHLVDGSDRVRGQRDAPPAGGAAPTRSWLTNETVTDERELSLAADAPPGRYRVAIGFYLPSTGARVPLTEGASGDRLLFGDVEVTAR